MRYKQQKLFTNNSWLMYYNNAPALTALCVQEFLASKQITLVDYMLYSFDLASNDFFLYWKFNEVLKGRHFGDIEDKVNMMAAVKAIPKKESVLKNPKLQIEKPALKPEKSKIALKGVVGNDISIQIPYRFPRSIL